MYVLLTYLLSLLLLSGILVFHSQLIERELLMSVKQRIVWYGLMAVTCSWQRAGRARWTKQRQRQLWEVRQARV